MCVLKSIYPCCLKKNKTKHTAQLKTLIAGPFPVLCLMIGSVVTRLVPDEAPPVNITGFEGLTRDEQRVLVASSVTFLAGIMQVKLIYCTQQQLWLWVSLSMKRVIYVSHFSLIISCTKIWTWTHVTIIWWQGGSKTLWTTSKVASHILKTKFERQNIFHPAAFDSILVDFWNLLGKGPTFIESVLKRRC